jgi:hypothetical protein
MLNNKLSQKLFNKTFFILLLKLIDFRKALNLLIKKLKVLQEV